MFRVGEATVFQVLGKRKNRKTGIELPYSVFEGAKSYENAV